MDNIRYDNEKIEETIYLLSNIDKKYIKGLETKNTINQIDGKIMEICNICNRYGVDIEPSFSSYARDLEFAFDDFSVEFEKFYNGIQELKENQELSSIQSRNYFENVEDKDAITNSSINILSTSDVSNPNSSLTKEEFQKNAVGAAQVLSGVLGIDALNNLSQSNEKESINESVNNDIDKSFETKFNDGVSFATQVLPGVLGINAFQKNKTSKQTNVVKIIDNTGTQKSSAGTTSELEKRLKEKEVELENAEIEKRRAIAAESEAQDKLNRAKAEQKELDKKMAKLASEKEDAQIKAEQLKTENEELHKKLEEKTTPIKVEPQPEPTPEPQPEPTPEPQPEPTPEPQPQPTPEPEPQPTPQPQAQPRTYTETQVSQPAASQTPPVEVKPSEQPVVEEPKPATEVQPTTPKQDTGSSLPNPNAESTDTGTRSSSSSKGSSVAPIAVGLGAAVAGGIGIKAIHDHRKNSKFDDQNEDSVTNGNRFWTEEDPNVIHTEEDLFNDESSSNSENVSYQAVENNNDNNDTWNIEESEISDDNTFDLLSENN